MKKRLTATSVRTDVLSLVEYVAAFVSLKWVFVGVKNNLLLVNAFFKDRQWNLNYGCVSKTYCHCRITEYNIKSQRTA